MNTAVKRYAGAVTGRLTRRPRFPLGYCEPSALIRQAMRLAERGRRLARRILLKRLIRLLLETRRWRGLLSELLQCNISLDIHCAVHIFRLSTPSFGVSQRVRRNEVTRRRHDHPDIRRVPEIQQTAARRRQLRRPRASPRVCRKSPPSRPTIRRRRSPRARRRSRSCSARKSVETAVQIQTDYAKSPTRASSRRRTRSTKFTSSWRPKRSSRSKPRSPSSRSSNARHASRARERGPRCDSCRSGSASRRPFFVARRLRRLIEIRTCATVANWRTSSASHRPLAPEARGA